MPSVPTRFQHLVETLLLHDFLYMLTCYDYANDLHLLIGIITNTVSSYFHPLDYYVTFKIVYGTTTL